MHEYIMQCLLQVRSIVSSYNDLKVELPYKIKIQPVDCLFELQFIIIVRFIAAIKVKNQSTSTLSLMCGPSVQKAVRWLWKKQSFSFFFGINDCIIRRCSFTLSFHENWELNCFSVTLYGEGKRTNEFAEWHMAWLAEWHNYVECIIYAEWPKEIYILNWKVRPFLAPINLQT